jgi:CHAD domain-containing protein
MRGRTHPETERKYDLPAGVRVPALDRIPGVATETDIAPEQLDATYFDTEDLRLATAGLTLRRRTGGPDAGWHLKVPSGPDTREEIRVPLARSDGGPPAELADLVHGLTRGAPLTEVARIVTDRGRRRLLGDDGRTLAEVTQDQVTARRTGRLSTAASATQRWQEVEVELAGADRTLLDAAELRLRTAGITRSASESKLGRVLRLRPARHSRPGPQASAGEVVLAYLRIQADAIARHDVLVRWGAPDAVHQLRLATLRMRAALRVYGRVLDRDRTRALTGELRWLGRRLGPARDTEVRIELLRARVSELPTELVLGPVDGRITRYFAPIERGAEQAVRKTLRGRRYLRLLDEIDRLLADPPLTARAHRRARAELPRHVRRAYRRTRRRMHALDNVRPGADRDAASHAVRKAAKRLRYAVECAAPAAGKPARRTLRRVKKLSSLLGAYQDSVVTRAVTRELGSQAHLAAENGFTFGLVHGRLLDEAQRAAGKLPARWKRVRSAAKWLR